MISNYLINVNFTKKRYANTIITVIDLVYDLDLIGVMDICEIIFSQFSLVKLVISFPQNTLRILSIID